MDITNYTYEVLLVDEAARCMTVAYSSEGNPTMHIGARLPYEGETLEEVIKMYAPLRHWSELKTPLAPVLQGASSVVSVLEPPSLTLENNALTMRHIRLTESDWTQLLDAPLSPKERADWAVYRQALRDITQQPSFPQKIYWPAQPTFPVTVL